ncbi:GntR family transcriptional regulator [Megasphaera cerevisiae DSM 20462]|jgi:DNA-binding FadR family transcriptional regulator|uniref:GntR family transcriptional regulator n=1 Tax=Megasphaera cerevisiae DSM 20462 TaxID=1122219 RepID=A0A0J6ZLB4_9FIRM|nr:FadR/GntR family transcriptional regulator [Megasphaera cerevisiae]KMO85641.1 GntR family transcriptional regulator [Megasphaera cerevisiae DSM 20462]SKA14299.1 DNA-binding transcriptional regulator, FadR family [Megasphaera cerevisiae DSM 20462]
MEKPKAAGSMAKETADKIIDYIIKNQMLPGDKMPTEAALTESMGVSRSTIREAIKILSARNILEILQGSGAYISPRRGVPDDPLGLTFIYDADRLAIDLLDVRTMIEPQAAMLAAMHATDQQCSELRGQCSLVERLIRSDTEYEAEDIELHKKICEASGNRILINLSYILHSSIKKTIIATSDALRDNNTYIYHRKIVEAIAHHDPISAYNSMMCHVGGLREYIASKIAERQKTSE